MQMYKTTPFRELYHKYGYQAFGRFIHFEQGMEEEVFGSLTVEEIENGLPSMKQGTMMGLRNPNFHAADALHGLVNLCKHMERQEKVLFPVYNEEEEQANPELEQVRMFYLKGEPEKPFVLVCAGGAYMSVCSLGEAFPVADKLNALGYTVFILNYRTNIPELFPRPMEDLTRAVKRILYDDVFEGFDKRSYALLGFSAGAHLVAEFGTDNLGYKAGRLPAPGIIILAYPAIQMELQAPESAEWFYDAVLGADQSQDRMDTYSVNKHMGSGYPPTFLTQCEDDSVVPFENARVMKKELERWRIPNKTKFGKKGGHGYALGNGTDAEGWLEDAVAFWESLRNSRDAQEADS